MTHRLTTKTTTGVVTVRLKVKPESYRWLDAASVEVNQVWNFCNERSEKTNGALGPVVVMPLESGHALSRSHETYAAVAALVPAHGHGCVHASFRSYNRRLPARQRTQILPQVCGAVNAAKNILALTCRASVGGNELPNLSVVASTAV